MKFSPLKTTNTMTSIPENITEFLYWVKEKTEAYWQKDLPQVIEEGLHGAKWIGLSEPEIDQAEEKYGIKFTPDHREFLKILHTLDRKQVIWFKYNAEVFYEEHYFFYDWTNEQEIQARMNWSYEAILEDIKANKIWIESWGNKPDSDEEKVAIFGHWYQQAPKLIPLTSHRFLISEPVQPGNPVLSVYGYDTIVYGWNLRHYLLGELSAELELYEPVFDSEGQIYDYELNPQVQEIQDREYAANRQIPFWEEIIAYRNSGWKYTPSNQNFEDTKE